MLIPRAPQFGETPIVAPSWDYAPRGHPLDVPDLVVVTCTDGHRSRMSPRIHRISPGGIVSPSYVCPRLGCRFHEFVVLDGYTPPAHLKHQA